MRNQVPFQCIAALLLSAAVGSAQSGSNAEDHKVDVWEQHFRILQAMDHQEKLFAQHSGMPVGSDEFGLPANAMAKHFRALMERERDAARRTPNWTNTWMHRNSNGTSYYYEGDDLVRESKQDDLQITVRGKVRDHRWDVSHIEVRDGDSRLAFADSRQVPDKYRKAVDRIMQRGVAM